MKPAIAGIIFAICGRAAVFDVKTFGAKGAGKTPDRVGATGRTKLCAESNGDFRNITNITMRDVSNAPIFIRLGNRMRAPEGTRVNSDKPAGSPTLVLLKSENVTIRDSGRLPDGRTDRADRKEM